MYRQTTITETIEIEGVNVYNGRKNYAIFNPAPEDSGLVFKLKGERIPARLESAKVISGLFYNTIGLFDVDENVSIRLIEHCLSPIYALSIDNLEIELSDNVCPTTNNCAAELFSSLKDKRATQNAGKKFWKYNGKKSHVVYDSESNKPDFLSVDSSDSFVVEDSVYYHHRAVGSQNFTFTFSEDIYESEIAAARSPAFLGNDLFKDIFLFLGKKGFYGINEENYLLVTSQDSEKYGNPENFGVRYNGDEFVRHKVLDVLGTLALTGRQFKETYFHFSKTGHKFDLWALKKLFSEGYFVECD